MLLALSIIYVSVYLICYPFVGLTILFIEFILIAIGGWFYGICGGLLYAVVLSCIGTILVQNAHEPYQLRDILFTTFFELSVGAFAGWTGNNHRKIIKLAFDLDQKHEALEREIKERKLLEEQLRIRERMDSIGTLAGGIAHDFNNLLTGIMGNLDLLRKYCHDINSKHRNYLEQSYQICRTSARLIKSIQSLSDESVSKTENVDIYHVAKDVFAILSRTTDRLIEKYLDIPPETYIVRGQHGKLHQVLLNLGMNAVHAIERKETEPGDFIRIYANDCSGEDARIRGFDHEQFIHIVFEDSGTGMTETVKRRAFDPLFTTRNLGNMKGQGLGLAMVYKIVTQDHSGFIDIESEEGKGAKFHIFLPKADKIVPKAAVIETPEVTGGSETILLIEDELSIGSLVKEAMTEFGYTVLFAPDGESGLELFIEKAETVDLVILDLALPKLPGKTVLKEILKRRPDAKVLIASGFSETELKGIDGAKGYITKPYSMDDLAMHVRRAIDS